MGGAALFCAASQGLGDDAKSPITVPKPTIDCVVAVPGIARLGCEVSQRIRKWIEGLVADQSGSSRLNGRIIL